MNEIDDKIDYEPGTPEQLSFLKALLFLLLAALVLAVGTFFGWSAGTLVALIFVAQFGAGSSAIDIYSMLSATGGCVLAACIFIPRLHRALYRW